MSWTTEEFADVNLGDNRLNSRFLKTAEFLADKPSQTINKALEDYKTKKAAYRLFSNDKCTPDKIIAPHIKKTAERIKGHEIILSIHDTTFLNYSKHIKTTGLGNIGGKSEQYESGTTKGLVCHASLALNEAGLPLGLQSLNIWSRNENDSPFKVESEKWQESFKLAYRPLVGKKTKLIYVADREADQFELMFDINKKEQFFVIRSKFDRLLIGNRHKSQLSGLLNYLDGGKNLEIDDPKNNRKAVVTVKYSKISFNDPKVVSYKHIERHDIARLDINVVDIKEENPPLGIEPLRWTILTNLEVKSDLDALKIMNYYRKRWNIESFFKVFKKGCCEVEDCRLQTRDRLVRYLTLFSVISWRMYWLVHMNRTTPKSDCNVILTEIEKKALYCHINKGPPPKDPIQMTVYEAVRAAVPPFDWKLFT